MKNKYDMTDNHYTAFFYVHFNEFPPYPSQQQIYAGVSRDGLHWSALNNNNYILASDINEKAARDPFIIRAVGQNKFYMLATDQDLYREEYRQDENPDQLDWAKLDSNGSQDIIVWESNDLIHWDNCWALKVGDYYDAGCCWAPKAIYDYQSGDYFLMWSSTVKSEGSRQLRVFAAKTKDFKTITRPCLYTEPQRWAIDTSVYFDQRKKRYYRLSKLDNRNVIEHSDSLYDMEHVTSVKIGNYWFPYIGANFNRINNKEKDCLESFVGPYEGAALFKMLDGKTYGILIDEYGNEKRGYILFTTDDLDHPNSIKIAKQDSYQMPPGAKHGCVIPITEKEYLRLKLTYGKSINM